MGSEADYKMVGQMSLKRKTNGKGMVLVFGGRHRRRRQTAPPRCHCCCCCCCSYCFYCCHNRNRRKKKRKMMQMTTAPRQESSAIGNLHRHLLPLLLLLLLLPHPHLRPQMQSCSLVLPWSRLFARCLRRRSRAMMSVGEGFGCRPEWVG